MSNSTDLKLKKTLPKPKPALLMKDYLLDDLSSCSSNGFKSFPRRQCCATVPFLLQVDHVKNAQLYKRNELLKIKSKSASSATRSAFQRASDAVIHVLKKIPFGYSKSSATLTKSFSRKFMKRSFWKRTQHKEIKRLKSFGDVKSKLSGSSPIIPVMKSTISVIDSSNSTNNRYSDSKSNSWSGMEFTTSSDELQCLSSNSAISEAESKLILPEKMKVSGTVGVTGGECSADTTTTSTEKSSVDSSRKKEWINGEEKEQLSPVSVLDFPGNDEDELSSPFQHDLLHTKGNNHKLSQKTHCVSNLLHIEHLNLETCIALSESKNKEEDDTKTKLEVVEFIKKIKIIVSSSISIKFNTDKLLMDFFEETNKFDEFMLNVASNWIKGQSHELFLGWQIQKNRDMYIRDMEKKGDWRELYEDKKGVVFELEYKIFTNLVNELLF